MHVCMSEAEIPEVYVYVRGRTPSKMLSSGYIHIYSISGSWPLKHRRNRKLGP